MQSSVTSSQFPTTAETKRVLSIQSHVVSGFVGNKCGNIALQTLGVNVDPINSVHFSNHTGYKSFKGRVNLHEEMLQVFSALQNNSLDKYDALLTGYIHGQDYLKNVNVILEKLKNNEKFIFACDPVLGDDGKMAWFPEGIATKYVPQNMVAVYKNLVRKANIITPNKFEAELLTNLKIHDEKSSIVALQALNKLGPEIVLITGVELENYYLYALQMKNGQESIYRCKLDFVDLKFVGSGDLFCALFLGWFLKLDGSFEMALQKSLSTMQYILKDTKRFCGLKRDSFSAELRLVENITTILNPPNTITVEEINN